MAQPSTARFGDMLIELGDNATPTVYAAPCGFSSKGINLSKNLQEVNIPDCDDPDAPTWVARDVISQTATITGEGVAAGESLPDWNDAFMATTPVPMRVTVDYEGVGSKVYEGKFHLESENITAEQGGRVSLAISAVSDGPVTSTWTASP